MLLAFQARLEFSTKLFGGFRQDYTLRRSPPGWKRYTLPVDAFSYERLIAQSLTSRQADVFRVHGECPFWFARRALYQAYDRIGWIAGHERYVRELPAVFGAIADAAALAAEALSNLQDLLKEAQGFDPGVERRYMGMIQDDDEVATDRRRGRDAEHLLRFDGQPFTRDQIFDPRQIGQFLNWCEHVELHAAEVKDDNSLPRNRRVEADRRYVRHMAGVLWLFITGRSPPQSNTKFTAFMETVEGLFFTEDRAGKGRSGADTVAKTFDALKIDRLRPSGKGLVADFEEIAFKVECHIRPS